MNEVNKTTSDDKITRIVIYGGKNQHGQILNWNRMKDNYEEIGDHSLIVSFPSVLDMELLERWGNHLFEHVDSKKDWKKFKKVFDLNGKLEKNEKLHGMIVSYHNVSGWFKVDKESLKKYKEIFRKLVKEKKDWRQAILQIQMDRKNMRKGEEFLKGIKKVIKELVKKEMEDIKNEMPQV